MFQTHCASCHGERAQGLTEDWRKIDADGNYPPPPLNGSAHAWHHPMVILERTIAEGGVALGGVMPGFSVILDKHDTRAAIAYVQSLWTDEIYGRWEEINARQALAHPIRNAYSYCATGMKLKIKSERTSSATQRRFDGCGGQRAQYAGHAIACRCAS